ncbi:uncharacterized protein V6R79_025068 [Siganus canaliculatus]
MKTFSVAVAVAVVLTFICLQQSSAGPLPENEDVEEPLSVEQHEMPVESWQMPYHNRHKRLSRAAPGCRWCCNCCQLHGACGVCCDF